MKNFFKAIIVLLVLVTGFNEAKAAIAINSFSIQSQYLINGQVGINGNTSIVFDYSITRGMVNGQYENTIPYVRLVYKSTTGVLTNLIDDIAITNFGDSYMYSGTASATIPAGDIGGTIVLDVYYWDENNTTHDMQSSTTYTTVSTATPPPGGTGVITGPQTRYDTFITNGYTDNDCYNVLFGDPYVGGTYKGTKITVSDTQPVLLVGQSIYSPNQIYRLTLQADGNLVLYKKNADGSETGLWSSRTVGKNSTGLYFQTDGNLVLYGDNHTPTNAAVGTWASMIYNNTGFNKVHYAYYLLQNDGNFVMYWPTYGRKTGLVWAITAATDTGNNGVGKVTAHGGSVIPYLADFDYNYSGNFSRDPWPVQY